MIRLTLNDLVLEAETCEGIREQFELDARTGSWKEFIKQIDTTFNLHLTGKSLEQQLRELSKVKIAKLEGFDNNG